MGNSDQWKDRYQRAVGELNHLKVDWENERKALQRAIIKLTGALTSVDEQLESVLDDLRASARGKASRDVFVLNKKIDDFERGWFRAEERRKASNEALIEVFRSLNAQLKPLVCDEAGRRALALLDVNMSNILKSPDEPPALQWLKIISNLSFAAPSAAASASIRAEQTPSQQLGAAKGLLKKILRPGAGVDKKQSSDAARTADSTEEDTSDRTQELAEIARVCTEICHALYAFLVALDPPESLAHSTDPLRAQLKKDIKAQDIPPAIKSLSDIAISTLQHQGEDFEAFLKNTEKSLGTINETLAATGESRKALGDGGERLDSEIRDQMQNLSDDIDQATELEPLKSKVQANIQAITGKLHEYQLHQAEQEQCLMSQLQLLVQKVANMEIESKKAEQALENQIAKTYMDVLTEVPNRAAYENRISEEYARWKRYGHPLSLVICDIDEFKAINDAYGHLAGDKALKIIGKTLKNQFRNTDFIARYGGEEFVIVLPETNQEQATLTAEKVKKAIGELAFRFRNEQVKITASFGVAAFEGEQDTPSSVFERADQALYSAKTDGRNRVICAS